MSFANRYCYKNYKNRDLVIGKVGASCTIDPQKSGNLSLFRTLAIGYIPLALAVFAVNFWVSVPFWLSLAIIWIGGAFVTLAFAWLAYQFGEIPLRRKLSELQAAGAGWIYQVFGQLAGPTRQTARQTDRPQV